MGEVPVDMQCAPRRRVSRRAKEVTLSKRQTSLRGVRVQELKRLNTLLVSQQKAVAVAVEQLQYSPDAWEREDDCDDCLHMEETPHIALQLLACLFIHVRLGSICLDLGVVTPQVEASLDAFVVVFADIPTKMELVISLEALRGDR